MNNKDLFNAINDAAEELAPEVWESTEGERPVMLRAVKKPHNWIKTALASAAAVLVVGAAVAVGANIYSQRGTFLPNSSGNSGEGDIERNFAPLTDDIVRIRDVGFYSNNPSIDGIGYDPNGNMVGFMPSNGAADGFSGSGTLEGFPGIDMMDYIKEWYKDPKPREFFYSDMIVDFIPPKPDIYYFNDLPLDARMLSDEAYDWLYHYCLMSEEDREGMTGYMPDYVKQLVGGGFMRYGDLGFLCDKYTEEELKNIRNWIGDPPQFSVWTTTLPLPDVYYYNDIPYHLNRVSDNDSKNWLKWFCWLDEETQSRLDGYVPEYMTGTIVLCNSEKLEEIVTYKGIELDVRSVSHDAETYIKWYNTLSPELQAKVGYEPGELYRKFPGAELPIEVYGPDGERLTFDDLKSADIMKMAKDGKNVQHLSFDEVEQCEAIYLYDTVYLAEPGKTEFKKYHIGDEICGLKIKSAVLWFERYYAGDPILHYTYGCVEFEGEVTMDAAVRKMGNSYQAVVSGELPLITLDNEQYDQGIIVPKIHGIPDDLSKLKGPDYYGRLYGDNDRLYNNEYTVLHDVRLENVTMKWLCSVYSDIGYQFSADLCYEEGDSSAYDWVNSGLVIPAESFTDVVPLGWSTRDPISDWDLDTMKSEKLFLKQAAFLTKYGAEAYSVGDGEVCEVDSDIGRGRYVVVKHGERLYTVYSNLCEDKEIPVKVGDKVTAGQLIGYAGTSGELMVGPVEVDGVVGYEFRVVGLNFN